MGPGVFVVHYEDVDGNALVVQLDFAMGLDVLPFVTDIGRHEDDSGRSGVLRHSAWYETRTAKE